MPQAQQPTYDLLIRNGLVIDGSGMPAQRIDVAVKDGLIAAVGRIDGAAAREIDAEGRMVCPGFIDIHTHYDPHWWWDPLATSSSWQGVTTVVQGNCGLTLAPCKPQDRELMKGLFSAVEEVSMATLDAILPWSWETFGEYLDALTGRLGVNVATLVGHAALRYHAMGAAAAERAATPEEIGAMQELLRDGMRAGGFGWSTSLSPTHVDLDGAPIPTRYAADDELHALADTLGEFSCGAIEVIPKSALGGIDASDKTLLEQLAIRSGRPLNWLGHGWKWDKPDQWQEEQAWMEAQTLKGAMILANITMQPFDRQISFRRSKFFDGFEVWRDIMREPFEARKAKFADPTLRPALRKALDNPDFSGKGGSARPRPRWEGIVVNAVMRPDNQGLVGKSVVELAAMRGVHLADAMLDLAVSDDFETIFDQRLVLPSDAAIMGETIQNPHVVLGSSDSGAHIASMVQAGEATYCLTHWVAQNAALKLEEAIRRLTFVPASIFGLQDRGLIRPGMKADLNVISLDALEMGDKQVVHDLPTGESRWIQKARGIDCTIVNGQVLMERGEHTGAYPGEVLRSAAYLGA